MNRDFDLIHHDGLIRFINYMLRILSWISLIMPLLALAVWSAGLIIRATDFNKEPVGGICVLLVGAAFFFVTFGVFSIKWNNYQFKTFNGVCFAVAFTCLTAY